MIGWSHIFVGALLSVDIPLYITLDVWRYGILNWLVTVGRGRLHGRAKYGGASALYVGVG